MAGNCDGDRSRAPTLRICVFACRPVAMIAPSMIVRLGALRRKYPPVVFELCPRLVECPCGAAALLAGVRYWIEAAQPLPLRGCVRIPEAARDRADAQIAKIDLQQSVRSGEGGHGPIKRAHGRETRR